MNKLTRISATVASSVALVAGFAGAVSADSISGSGDDSSNYVKNHSSMTSETRNDTDVDVENNNPQDAKSGDVKVENNDDLGSATSGSAMNDSTTSGHVAVTNTAASSDSAGGMGAGSWGENTISETDDDSYNRIENSWNSETTVDNETDVTVENNNHQTAESGNVWVEDNDDVENVTSGDASNMSHTSFDVTVTND